MRLPLWVFAHAAACVRACVRMSALLRACVCVCLCVCVCVCLQVYDHHYKAVVDGRETDSLLEIDPGQRIEIFRMGNGSDEVLEVHDFKNVSTESRGTRPVIS